LERYGELTTLKKPKKAIQNAVHIIAFSEEGDFVRSRWKIEFIISSVIIPLICGGREVAWIFFDTLQNLL